MLNITKVLRRSREVDPSLVIFNTNIILTEAIKRIEWAKEKTIIHSDRG